MNKYSFVKLLNEAQKEFAIWGVPPGKKDEELLYTKAKSQKEADKVKDVLEKKHKCKNVRIQSFTMNKDIAKDWKKLTNGEITFNDIYNKKYNLIKLY